MYVAVLNAPAQRDFDMPKWWSMARSALVSTLIVHSATLLDARWHGTGVQLCPSRSQMSRVLPIDNSRPLSIMISRILFSDPSSAATLNGLNTSTADLRRSGLVYTARLYSSTTTYPYSLSQANTIGMGPCMSTWTRDTRSPVLSLPASSPPPHFHRYFQCCHHPPLCRLTVIPMGSWTSTISSNHPTAFFGQRAPDHRPPAVDM